MNDPTRTGMKRAIYRRVPAIESIGLKRPWYEIVIFICGLMLGQWLFDAGEDRQLCVCAFHQGGGIIYQAEAECFSYSSDLEEEE